MSGDQSRMSSARLRDLVRRIFVACSVPAEQATLITDHLVRANLRGVDSHGVSRVGIYVQRLRAGLVRPTAHVTTVRETPVSAVLDGGNGSGIVIAEHAMRTAIRKADESGIGLVSVRGSNHCGMLAYYTSLAARAGLIGFATTSAPALMAPWGASERFFGTNPLSYAIPLGEHEEIVFDMATSEVALGKILLAARENTPIPIGWALTGDGEPTDDPHEAARGILLPLGGPKGSGLALLVETLSSVLASAPVGPHIPALYHNPDREQGLGHFFLAMRPDLFRPKDEFLAAMRQLADELRALPALAGHERVFLPGEIEARHERERAEHGIPMSAELRAELLDIAEQLGVSSD